MTDVNDMNEWNKKIIEEFRANDGKVGGMFEGAPLVLLHTVGAKSGTARINPLMAQVVGDDLAVFASAGGSTSNPAWYHNLLATPSVTVEFGTETFTALARIAEGDEHSTIWERQKASYPQFAGYETTANRVIPVVILTRK